MMKILFFILYLVVSHISPNVDGIQHKLEEDLDFERKLKPISNSPVKTILTKFGDIVDCIDIYKQPAFDHPLLKDHVLQKKPSFQNLIGKTTINNSQIGSMLALDEDSCPLGTVPIRRTTKDDLNEEILPEDRALMGNVPGLHIAQVSMRKNYGPYYGVSGVNSIYNPRVHKNNQVSLSHIWIENGPLKSTNKISLGWHVHPDSYGGNPDTRFFSSWTSDNYHKTGCSNHKCRGFVQTDRYNYLGGHFSHKSIYGGPTYEFTISISQDAVTKNWWISLGDKHIGYYPAKLFSNLSSASTVGWGGRTKTESGSPSPQMGSGYFPDGNSTHACYFRHVLVEDASRKVYGPDIYHIIPFSDKTDCFDVKFYGNQGRDDGQALQFGGPGGGNCGD